MRVVARVAGTFAEISGLVQFGGEVGEHRRLHGGAPCVGDERWRHTQYGQISVQFPAYTARAALLGSGDVVRRDPAHAVVFGSLSSKWRCRAGYAFGRARSVPTSARGVSARAAGQLSAIHAAYGADPTSTCRVATEDLGDDAWLGFRRRRCTGAP